MAHLRLRIAGVDVLDLNIGDDSIVGKVHADDMEGIVALLENVIYVLENSNDCELLN